MAMLDWLYHNSTAIWQTLAMLAGMLKSVYKLATTFDNRMRAVEQAIGKSTQAFTDMGESIKALQVRVDSCPVHEEKPSA